MVACPEGGLGAVDVQKINNTVWLPTGVSTSFKRTPTSVAKKHDQHSHLVRGTAIPTSVRQAILDKNVPAVFAQYLFGFVKDDHRRPDPKSAVNVTAKWTCTEPSIGSGPCSFDMRRHV